jgi:hypothetical protein
MKLRCRVLGLLLVPVILAGVGGVAQAAAIEAQQCNTAGFLGLTGSCPDLSTGRSQFFMDILNGPQAGQAIFQFRNTGATPSSITGIFFEDRGGEGTAGTQVLTSIAVSAASAGVLFAPPGNTVDLPGGNLLAPVFQASQPFTLVADAPAGGIHPGQSLDVTAHLQPNKAAQDVLNAVRSGQVRIGLQAEGFASGNAASFFNTNVCVPAPGALLLGAVGAALFGGLRRYRKL